jgi:hypothetical protein
MDTRFWGPSGWKLLHSITFAYSPKNKAAVKELFTTLPFVLPCKFCRASLSEYMEKDPLAPALDSANTLSKWLWRIHNEVNKKLRSQKLRVEPDPPFEQVKTFYEDLLATGCSKTNFEGWDFLFSIAELHPMSKSARGSIAIKDAPPCDTLVTAEQRNRWNCLDATERLVYYKRFWLAVGPSLPFSEWRSTWLRPRTLSRRQTTLRWLWKTRCTMEKGLNLLNKCKYYNLCKTLKRFRSGCAKSVKAKTCRKRTRIPLTQNRDAR